MKPFHPAVEAALRSVDALLRREMINGDQARIRVRVEMTRDIEIEMRATAEREYPLIRTGREQHVGPMTFMGVSFYVVDHLPAPGWRVISA